MTAAGEPARQVAGLPEDLHQGAEGPQVELGAEHLDRRGVGHVEVPLRALPRHLPVDEAEELELGVHPGQVLLHPLLVDHPPTVGQLGGLGPGPHVGQHALDDAGRAQRDPLVVELVGDEVPALVLAADQAGGRDPHVLVERVVDVVVAEELHRHHADAGRVHGDDEHGDPLVLGHVGIGPGGQPDVVGVAGQAGEDLGAVDDVLVAVAHGPGGQRGEVGARVGLGVADAEGISPARILGRKNSFCSCVPKFMIVGPTVLMVSIGTGRAAAHRLVEEDELLDGRAALPAPLRRPADAEPAVAAHLLDHLAHHGPDAARLRQLLLDLGGQQVLVVGAQLALQRLLLLGVGNLHRVPPGWRGRIGPRQRHVVAGPAVRARRARTRYSPPRSGGQWGRRGRSLPPSNLQSAPGGFPGHTIEPRSRHHA